MCKVYLLKFLAPVLILASCSQPTTIPLSSPTNPPKKVIVIDYPPLDWSINRQRSSGLGCDENLQESCPGLVVLGCDDIEGPRFYLGGLQPPYAVMECIHENGEPPNSEYFKQPAGLDTRYRSYAIYQEGKFRLIIKKSEFKKIFAPVESTGEAISYAMAMTSLMARFDINPKDEIEYLVDVIEETHAEETPEGYLVYLFDWSHKMGCDIHPFYAVKVLVTREGDVHEVERQEIYRNYSCFDYGMLTLDDD
jgi:hypothetical protein